MTDSKKKWLQKFSIMLVIILLINLPIVSALEISNVHAEEVTDTSAVIKWNTDQPADSFVNYGTDENKLKTLGDASAVTDHEIALTNLTPETAYEYSVRSGNKTDDNSGSFYSLNTAARDTTPPKIELEIPPAIKGDKLSLSGKTEAGAAVKVYVNGQLAGTATAIALITAPLAAAGISIETESGTEAGTKSESSPATGLAASSGTASGSGPELNGRFVFSNLALNNNQFNEIKVEATDRSGNAASVESKVFADTSKPKLQLGKIPDLIGEKTFELKGTFSENASYEIFVNNKSIAKGAGTSLQQKISLEEGKNAIKIILIDAAGWETEQMIYVTSDTKAPTVKFDLSKGNEYYQGRVSSGITGTTEAGAVVYLYVYRPAGYEFSPEFDKAWAKVTADENGAFTFDETNFEMQPISFEDLAPREIPSGLRQETIFPIEDIQAKQKWTYFVYLIAEDQSGKSGYAKKTITVNTCYSADSDFDVQSLAQFQAPLRLNPTLLDEGREEVTAVFELKYRGKGVSSDSGETFQIQNVQFDKACTQGMMEDENVKLGCTLFPNQPKKTPSADKTAWYVTAKLNTAEKLSEKKEDFWNEFKNRQIVFPMKIRITYRENLGNGQLGETKTQTACYDLSYFVDIPIDSKDMLPDWLAVDGLQAVEWTIDKIDLVLPYLEKAIMVTGITWVSAFLGKMAVRYLRIVTSKLEAYFSRTLPEDKQCPMEQHKYYLLSTIEDWKELEGQHPDFLKTEATLREDWDDEEKALDKLCPMTANLWKAEAVLDQVYRWSGDRFLCRAVPAGWTSTKEQGEVEIVEMKQNRCTASSRGVPLQEIENCQKLIEENSNVARPKAPASRLISDGEFTCYRNGNFLYTVKPQDKDSAYSSEGRVMELELAYDFGLSLQQADLYAGAGNLLAYKPYGSDQFIIAQDKSCQAACKNLRKPGFRAYTDAGVRNIASNGQEGSYGCFREAVDAQSGEDILVGANDEKLGAKQYSAGYTNDCFVDLQKNADGSLSKKDDTSLPAGASGLLQCVCTLEEKERRFVGARTAVKETEDGVAEGWDYQQDQIFKSSSGKFGTYYPEWRYYKGRDFSSAFGADYLLDYFREEKQVSKVSPNTQFLAAYQTICLSQIRAHLVTLRSILEGLRNCIREAKITGLRDAGICKTVFTQHVCGLIYKAIAYFFTSCSPYGVGDSEKESLEGVGAITDATFGSIGEAMQSSIDEAKSDYGNAKLNEYFAGGAQGFTQSLCMAAFGYDWPLGMDFIMDAAYSVPSKSSVQVFPADRELSTYDPSSGNAVYNYEVGAMIIPGCNVQSYNVYLKCVGPEDLGHPGVQCGKQGCDCLQIQQPSSALESEKIHYLDGGRGFNTLKQNTFFTPPIPSPQKVNQKYRYDHVVVELNLQSSEKGNEEKCFDEGYTDGKFYFPIVDVSPPGVGVCQVQPLTGEYFCPKFVELFGGGQGVYLQDPFISCYDADTQSWANCDSSNLFTKGREIKVRANVFTDGKQKYCVKLSTSGLAAQGFGQDVLVQQLPLGMAGSFPVEFPSLGTVEPGMFTGAVTTMVLAEGAGCETQVKFSGSYEKSQTLTFGYQVVGSDQYKVSLPEGVSLSSNYVIKGNLLTINGRELLTSAEIRAAQFSYQGFQFSNIIGAPSASGQCAYQIRAAAGTKYAANEKTFYATAELKLPDAAGNCYNSEVPVKTAIGRSTYKQAIKLQLEPLVSQVGSKMNEEFVKGNYRSVMSMAEGIIGRQKSDLDDAIAIYYLVSSYIIMSKKNNLDWKTAVKAEVCHLTNLFKTRDYGQGGTPVPYPAEVQNSAEYQKVAKYLGEIEVQAQCGTLT